MSRRSVLAGAVAAAGTLALGRRLPAAARRPAGAVELGGVSVLPREAWAAGLTPTGPLVPEPDVRYLLVHHSVEPGNAYGEGDVAGVVRGFFRFHTGPARGWPDIAYNFLVDRFGRVWEGRAGSLAGPVRGDATGGNQGFDQLCCFVGNHEQAEPTPEAFAAMAAVLGALARLHGIAVGPGATATFTSRGSNRHPAGTVVTTATIAAHRDMSRTRCPGDRVMARMDELRLLAAARVMSATGAPATDPPASPVATDPPASPVATDPPAEASATAAASPTSTAPPVAAPSASAASASASASPAPPVVGAPGPTEVAVSAGHGRGAHVGPAAAVAAAPAVGAAAATGAAVARRRSDPPRD